MAFLPVNVSLPEGMVDDLNALAEEFEEFRSRSHVVQMALEEFFESDDEYLKFLEEHNKEGR